MGNLTSTLTLALKDDGLQAKARADAEALKKLGASSADLKKLGSANPAIGKLASTLDTLAAKGAKLDAFKAGSRNLKDLGATMRQTRVEATRAAAGLVKAQTGADAKITRAAERTHKLTLKRSEDATAAFVEQGRAVRAIRNELASSGVGRAGGGLAIAEAMRHVERATADANQQLRQQVRLVATTGKADASAHVEAKRHYDTERRAAGERRRVSASGDMIAGMGGSGRATLGHIEAGRRLTEGMSRPARITADARAEADAERQRARATRGADRREAAGTIAAATSLYLSHKGKEIGLEAINSAARFDYGVRYQHIATDVSEEDQQRLLVPQAKRIGQETKFSNEDIVHAQTGAMQGLPFKDPHMKAEVGAAIVDQARNYAVIMGSEMTKASEGIRAFLQNTNKDISTSAKAVAEAQRGTNLVVKAAKLGGMNDDDAQEFMKFGLPSATQAGFSDVTSMALGALARRSGLRGSEAGVFLRAASSKLISPTKEGREAEIVAGIDRSKYQKMPDQLSAEAFEKIGKGRFGVKFNDSQKKRLSGMFGDGELLQDQQEFTSRVSGVVGESFDKVAKGKNKGQLNAQDAAKIAKLANDFYKMSVASTDVEGLLDAHLNSPNFTPALRNKFYTDKHGGKAGMVAQHFDQLKEDREELRHVAQTPTFASERAKYMTQGLGGSIDNVKGAYETAVLNLGTKNTALIQGTADTIAAAGDAIANLPDKTVQAGTALAAIGASGAAAASAVAMLGKFTGSTALTGLAGAGAAAMLPVLATAAVGGVLYAASDESKGLVHGGRPDISMNPGDELPGISSEGARRASRTPSLPPGASQPGSRAAEGVKSLIDAPATPKVDTSQLDGLSPKVEAAKQKVSELNSATARPTVDASSISAAEGAVDSLLRKLALVGNAAAGASSAVNGIPSPSGNLRGRPSVNTFRDWPTSNGGE